MTLGTKSMVINSHSGNSEFRRK